MFEVSVKLFLFPLQLSAAMRQLLASQIECSLSAIEYCNPPYLDLPFKMIEVSHKERSDCVSTFIKGVKHAGLNPTFKCFSSLCLQCSPAGEKEKQSEKILNAIAASVKHIINNVICDVQDLFLYSMTCWIVGSHRAMPPFFEFVCLYLSFCIFWGPVWGHFGDEYGSRKRNGTGISVESDGANLSTGGNHFTCQPLCMSSFIFRLEGREKAYNSIHSHPDVPLARIWHVAFLPFYFLFLNSGWAV